MENYKKSFKKLVEELASLDSFNDENITKWFNCSVDMSYQHDGISYKELEILLEITNKITERAAK